MPPNGDEDDSLLGQSQSQGTQSGGGGETGAQQDGNGGGDLAGDDQNAGGDDPEGTPPEGSLPPTISG